MRFTSFLLLLCSVAFLRCASNEVDNDPEVQSSNSHPIKNTLPSYIDFRVENYNVDTLTNYKASPEFFSKYIKGNEGFSINLNNPIVNAANIEHYVLDTIAYSDVDLLIVLEAADTKIAGSKIIAIVVNEDNTIKKTMWMALKEENDAWEYYWRSYIKNDTLHRLSTGMGDSDTSHTLLKLNEFRNIEVLGNTP